MYLWEGRIRKPRLTSDAKILMLCIAVAVDRNTEVGMIASHASRWRQGAKMVTLADILPNIAQCFDTKPGTQPRRLAPITNAMPPRMASEPSNSRGVIASPRNRTPPSAVRTGTLS
jgi:hypothetical protein